jgi:hypothetical protein
MTVITFIYNQVLGDVNLMTISHLVRGYQMTATHRKLEVQLIAVILHARNGS